MRAPFVFVVSWLCACSAGAPRVKLPDIKPAPPADLARIPGDAWVVGSVDLPPLRDATVWRWLRGIAGTHSFAVHWCPAQFDAASRVTFALVGEEQGRDSVIVVVDGIDRKALSACLHAPPAHVADVPGRGECDRYDAAVHAFDLCGVVPLSMAPALRATEKALAAGEPQEMCPKAAATVERAIARRDQLGWTCKRDDSLDWSPDLGKLVKDAGPDTVDLGEEAVRFLDDHTAAIVLGGRTAGSGQRDVVAELATVHPHSWFAAPAAAIDPRATAWFVADPRKVSSQPDKVPPMFTGTLELRSGVAGDLRIPGFKPEMAYEWLGIVEKLASAPELAGSTVAVGCIVEAPIAPTPEQQACSAGLEHAEELRGDALHGIDTKGFIAERVERCVADHWPASFVECLGAAANIRAIEACYGALPAPERERILDQKTLCGEHVFDLRVAIPQMRLEALKLTKALDREPRRDCRPATKGPATGVSIGASADPSKRLAAACFETPERMAATESGGGCTTVYLDDGKFDEHFEVSLPHPELYIAAAPDFTWNTPGKNPGVPADLAAHGGPPVTIVRDAKHLELCRGKDCTKLASPDAIAINRDGTLAAARTGAAVETWNLASHKKLAAFQLPAKDCVVTVVGESLFAGCPGAGYLATPAGKKIAAIGDADAIDAIADSPVWLGGTRWAFVARTGYALVIQDVATGAVERRIDLGHTAEPGMVSAAGDGQGAIAVAYGGSSKQAGTIAVVDPAGQVKAFQRELCPR